VTRKSGKWPKTGYTSVVPDGCFVPCKNYCVNALLTPLQNVFMNCLFEDCIQNRKHLTDEAALFRARKVYKNKYLLFMTYVRVHQNHVRLK